jgi:class 3 adenylate cyclase
MFCPRCGANVARGGENFCGDCGSPLSLNCNICGSENPAGKSFCTNCGAGLTVKHSKTKNLYWQPTAGRRQLTVMFVDLVGSTSLSARIDPEDLRDVIAAYHGCIVKIVAHFDGFIARYMGDGVLIYFGHPQAHEDDAERAVRAALEIINSVRNLTTIAGPAGTLDCRVGIATGSVVVGEVIGFGSSLESPVLGDTPNLAARLQTIAEPGTTVIAEATRRLVGGLFDCKRLGPLELKGIPAPVHAWAVVSERPINSRFEALHPGILPLVGRIEELDLLLRRWEQSKSGEGRVVLITGEAGIGKSRIAAALEQSASQMVRAPVRFTCSPHHQDSPLYPIIRQFERAAGFERDDPPAIRLEKLSRLLQANASSDPDVALIVDLLAIPRAEQERPDEASPQLKKNEALAAILRQFDKLTRRGAALVIFEDIHWADATTLDMLDLLVATVEQLRMLLVVTTRPEFQPHWITRPHVTVQTLGGLHRKEAATLIKSVANNQALQEEIVESIVARADGIPLFIEELTRSVLEGRPRTAPHQQHLEPIPAEIVPATLQASLMARLDRLGDATEIAQIGSVIGREFSFELLQLLSGLPRQQLEDAASKFEQAGLLVPHGAAPRSNFAFKHALVRDVAYASLLRKRRRAIHMRLAEILAAGHYDPENALPEIIAWHFAEAGAPDRAIDNYFKAAERTTGRFALTERVSHLRRALRQIEHLPDSPERDRRELTLQVALYQVLVDDQGSGSEDVRSAVERARALCLKLDDTKELIRVQDGLLNYYFSHSEPEKALRYANEMLEVGERTGDPQAFLMGRKTAGFANLLLGRFEMACENMRLLIETYDEKRDGPGSALSTRDSKVGAYTVIGICRTALGYLDSGAATSLEAVRHADSLNHHVSRIVALRRACVQRIMIRDTRTVLELSERLLGLATEFQTYKGARDGAVFHCWAMLQTRRDPALLQRMCGCIEQFDATQHWAMLPFFMASTAELMGKYGDVESATALLGRAAELVQMTGERWSEPEIIRLQACLGTHDPDHSIHLLQTSLRKAAQQHAKLWELRTATSLAALWLGQGNRTAAYEVLAPVHAWFSEGLAAHDLVAARALLDRASRDPIENAARANSLEVANVKSEM